MTFPEDFVMTYGDDRDHYKQGRKMGRIFTYLFIYSHLHFVYRLTSVGNAVPPVLSYVIAKEIMKIDEHRDRDDGKQRDEMK